MHLSLSKTSDVPLQQQLAEQIAFLIATGQLRGTRQLPSVRSLARRLKIHHNTVSKAYQDLVRRGWVRRQPGRRLYIGALVRTQSGAEDGNLDEMINQCIQRAREMGFSLQAFRSGVVKRLFLQPPDHILVVEHDPGLRQIMRTEISARVGRRVETCSPEEFARFPELAVGAQVVAPEHVLPLLKLLMPRDRPCISLTFSGVDEHVALIRGLAKSSVIGVASVSEALLKTARSLLGSVVGRQHAFRELLVSLNEDVDLRGIDILFCDSLTMAVVRCARQVHYRLVAPRCLEDLAATLVSSEVADRGTSARFSSEHNSK